jgi:TusA-related sulfurtransferase
LVILAIGVRPEVKLAAEAGLTIGQRKGIVVDDHMRTSDPDIYAVGDAVEVQDLVGGFAAVIPLAGPANRQGRIAAINALGGDATYERTQGTAICKVFDLAVGMTGLSEKALKRAGLAYEKVHVHPASHAGYYPGATQRSLKLLFHPENGKVLGAQCVGANGVDQRIDVLAVAIRVVKEMDACGLQCPGPIMHLKQAMDQIQPGPAVRISVTEPGFAADLEGWCHTTGSRLRDKQFDKGVLTAVVEKGQSSQTAVQAKTSNYKTLVVFSDAFDKAMAAFIIANGASAMGSGVTMFFTFWYHEEEERPFPARAYRRRQTERRAPGRLHHDDGPHGHPTNEICNRLTSMYGG